MIIRPSAHEINRRIRKARRALAEGRIAILNQEILVSDAIELSYLIEDELETVLSDLLNLISSEHYVGTKPPQRSYEKAIKDLELFAFEVESPRFNCWIYFKFVLRAETLWLVSLHKSRGLPEKS